MRVARGIVYRATLDGGRQLQGVRIDLFGQKLQKRNHAIKHSAIVATANYNIILTNLNAILLVGTLPQMAKYDIRSISLSLDLKIVGKIVCNRL